MAMSEASKDRLYVVVKNIKDIEERTKEARRRGALYHPTNPSDAWFCEDCSVFGKGDEGCWSCGKEPTYTHYVPRWGGGAQRVGDA